MYSKQSRIAVCSYVHLLSILPLCPDPPTSHLCPIPPPVLRPRTSSPSHRVGSTTSRVRRASLVCSQLWLCDIIRKCSSAYPGSHVANVKISVPVFPLSSSLSSLPALPPPSALSPSHRSLPPSPLSPLPLPPPTALSPSHRSLSLPPPPTALSPSLPPSLPPSRLPASSLLLHLPGGGCHLLLLLPPSYMAGGRGQLSASAAVPSCVSEGWVLLASASGGLIATVCLLLHGSGAPVVRASD